MERACSRSLRSPAPVVAMFLAGVPMIPFVIVLVVLLGFIVWFFKMAVRRTPPKQTRSHRTPQRGGPDAPIAPVGL